MTTQTNDAVPSGLRIREILTERKTIDGELVTVPALDAQGKEIEIYSIEVPREIEIEGAEAIDAHVAQVRARLNLTAPEVISIALPDPVPVIETAPNPPTDSEGVES
jgi:small-conductance mechanosensitive channel